MAHSALKKSPTPMAAAADDAIISVMDKRGTTVSMEKSDDQHIISVPANEQAGPSRKTEPKNTIKINKKPIEIVVYFADKTGLDLMVDDGQHATAAELFEMVMEELELPAEAREVFSLWLVSELLELQLKSTHVPFKLVSYWEEILEKYTEFSEEDEERDEPVIMFQRNVFYPITAEVKLTNEAVIRLLYHEAKSNFLDGRYPLTENECDRLTGIQAMITENHYDAAKHTAAYYKAQLHEYYPEQMCTRKLFSTNKKLEERLAEGHRKAATRLNPGTTESDKLRSYHAYLQQCRKLPYYGAVYFRGQIEHPHVKWSLTNVADDPVFVAINPRGVFIINMDTMVLDLGLRYEEMEWQYAEPHNRNDRNCLPCLFLQFMMDDDEEVKVTKVLQVFSREAFLMDCLIDACIRLKKSCPQANEEAKSFEASEQSMKKLQRLCLTTFNKEGLCVKTEARSAKRKGASKRTS